MENIEGILLSGHKEDAVEIPFDPGKEWGLQPQKVRDGRNGYFVQAQINGVAFESAIVPRMKKFFVLVGEAEKAACGISTGDKVRVAIEPLGAPRNS